MKTPRSLPRVGSDRGVFCRSNNRARTINIALLTERLFLKPPYCGGGAVGFFGAGRLGFGGGGGSGFGFQNPGSPSEKSFGT